MNLCIDQGNSRTKVAVFETDGTMVKSFIYRTFAAADIVRLCALYPIQDSIISSVVHLEPSVVNTLQRLSRRFILFDHSTPVPIINDYETPVSLGLDRLAAAVGATHLCPNENLLIIDVGSAITYDYVSHEGHYLGGNIAPGIKMRLTSLHQMTKLLPLVEVEENMLMPLFGRNTRDAIMAGVIRGIGFEVKGYMRTLDERVEHYQTILTGGNAGFVQRNVSAPMLLEKHLVLIGLNRILAYNGSLNQ